MVNRNCSLRLANLRRFCQKTSDAMIVGPSSCGPSTFCRYGDYLQTHRWSRVRRCKGCQLAMSGIVRFQVFPEALNGMSAIETLFAPLISLGG